MHYVGLFSISRGVRDVTVGSNERYAGVRRSSRLNCFFELFDQFSGISRKAGLIIADHQEETAPDTVAATY
jgi:hypothetical protein